VARRVFVVLEHSQVQGDAYGQKNEPERVFYLKRRLRNARRVPKRDDVGDKLNYKKPEAQPFDGFRFRGFYDLRYVADRKQKCRRPSE